MELLKQLFSGIFLSKRSFSLYWRTLDMLAVGLAGIAIEVTQGSDLPNWAIVFSGLVLGEITKHINSK